MTDNPMVTLNRAIAAAMVNGPATGLALLEGLDERLAGHHRLDAVRAHLLEMDGDREAAIAHYRTAAGREPLTAYARGESNELRRSTGPDHLASGLSAG